MRITIVAALYLINAVFAPNGALSIPLTLPIFIMCIVALARTKSTNVSIGDMFWFCVLLFFAVSPLQRIGTDLLGRGDLTTAIYSVEEYTAAFLVIGTFLLPFVFVRMDRPHGAAAAVMPGLSTPVLFGIAVVSLVLYSAAVGGIEGLLASRIQRRELDTSLASPLFLAALSACCCLLVAKAVARGPGRAWGTVLTASILLAVAANPFNISRFWLVAVWVPFVLCAVQGRLPAIYFYGAAAVALLVAFPILSITTRLGVSGIDSISGLDFLSNFFYVPFVDIIDTTVHTIRYMEQNDLTFGSKTVAILLFFVPRFIWPEKPIVGGLDVGRELHYYDNAGTDNLSFFIASDLYMDFWFLGPLIGGAILALSLRATLRSPFGWAAGQDLFKYLMIGSLPILIRGPVGAVLPLFACQIAMLMLVTWMPRAAPSAGTTPAFQEMRS